MVVQGLGFRLTGIRQRPAPCLMLVDQAFQNIKTQEWFAGFVELHGISISLHEKPANHSSKVCQ